MTDSPVDSKYEVVSEDDRIRERERSQLKKRIARIDFMLERKGSPFIVGVIAFFVTEFVIYFVLMVIGDMGDKEIANRVGGVTPTVWALGVAVLWGGFQALDQKGLMTRKYELEQRLRREEDRPEVKPLRPRNPYHD